MPKRKQKNFEFNLPEGKKSRFGALAAFDDGNSEEEKADEGSSSQDNLNADGEF